jgi:hypothetical protein
MDASRISATIVARRRRRACHLTYLQLILGSHIHGIDSDGVIISRKISRAKLIGTIEELAPAWRLEKLDAQLMALCRTNEACRRLSKLPGVGR